MNLGANEGTVAAYEDPSWYLPGRLASDPPGPHPGRIVRIDYDSSDGWRHERDGYVKTRQALPLSRIGMVSPLIITFRAPRSMDTRVEIAR